MVEPRMLMVSREIVSPGAEGLERFLVVILTARRAVFICGETEVMVPWTMVLFLSSMVTVSLAHFIRNLARDRVSTVSVSSVCMQHVPDELHGGRNGRSTVPPKPSLEMMSHEMLLGGIRNEDATKTLDDSAECRVLSRTVSTLKVDIATQPSPSNRIRGTRQARKTARISLPIGGDSDAALSGAQEGAKPAISWRQAETWTSVSGASMTQTRSAEYPMPHAQYPISSYGYIAVDRLVYRLEMEACRHSVVLVNSPHESLCRRQFWP